MTEPNPELGSAAGPPAPGEPAPSAPTPDQPATTGQWMAPTYDVHPPAEAYPIGPDGPSHFGGSASAAADLDQTTVLPVVGDGSPLVWPELRGTALIGRFMPLSGESAITPSPDQSPAPSAPSRLASPIDAVPVESEPTVARRVTEPRVGPLPVAVAAIEPELVGIVAVEPEAVEPEAAEAEVEAETTQSEPASPAADPPAVATLVKPEAAEPEVVEPEVVEPEVVEPEQPALAEAATADDPPIDIEPIVAVLTEPPLTTGQLLDPPTEVVTAVEPDSEPLPSSALITALQAISPPTVATPAAPAEPALAYAPAPAYPPPPVYAPSPVYAPPPAYAPALAYAPPLAYAQPASYSPMPAPGPAYDAPPPAPLWAAPVPRARATQSVTCPQCGTVVPVDPQSRSSLDFCPNPMCDFPLFWVKSVIVSDATAYGEGSSHRRLPGTAGRAISASMACPHCTELNPISGVLCVRCGLDLRPIAAPPPPAPVPLPDPVYVAQVVDDPINWWLIILVGALIVLFFAALAFVAVAYLAD